MADTRSWFTGTCRDCGYNVVVTQPHAEVFPDMDYWWYCSNKRCKHHSTGEHTGDMETPDWVDTTKKEVAT